MASNQSEPPGNKYTLLDLIGTGGMAEVFRGKLSGAEGFEKLVVLKKLLAQYSRDPEIVAHFISEAKLAALLQHENIAQIYDFGQLDGSYFIAMEYLLGKDLQSVMQKAREVQEPLGAERALYIITKVCQAMEYAHTLRDFQQQPLHIVHRDLSPHNVFITFDGRVKIIDFGIARADLFDNKTQIGVAKGKIAYMSPEQLAAKRIDHRSDIFAIGILLYEMLSSKRMYTGDTATMIRKCMQVEYDKLQTVSPGLHPAVYDILDKALEKDVGRRYQTCAHMQAEVEEVLFTLNRRPSPQILERYIGRLFARELAAEKDGLSLSLTGKDDAGDRTATAVTPSRAPAGQPPAPTREDLRGATGPAPQAEDATQMAGVGAENLSSRPSHKIKRVLTGSICGALLVVFAVFWQLTGDWEQSVPNTLPGQQRPAYHEERQQPHVAEESAAPSVPPKASASPPSEANRELLARAEEILRKSKPEPDELETARKLYEHVREEDPDNREALAGLERIREHHRAATEQTLNLGTFTQASHHVSKGMFLPPKDDRFSLLQETFEGQKQKKIAGLVEKAEKAVQNNRLTAPAEDNAHAYYLEILDFDPQNAAALEGIAKLADGYASLAGHAFRQMKIPIAREHVQQGLAISPQHRQLLELQRDLDRSRPGIFFKSVEKSILSLFEQGNRKTIR